MNKKLSYKLSVKVSYLMGVILLLAGMVLSVGPQPVLAQDTNPPVESPAAQAEEASAAPVEESSAALAEEVTTIPAEEAPEEIVTQVINTIQDNGSVMVIDGQVESMASQNTVESLSEAVNGSVDDPWFTGTDGKIYAYTTLSGTCVANVDFCTQVANPIQAAIDAAPAAAVIYINQNITLYAGDTVNVNKVVTLNGVNAGNAADPITYGTGNVLIGTVNLFVDIAGWKNIFAKTVNVLLGGSIQDGIDLVAESIKFENTTIEDQGVSPVVNVASGIYDQSVVFNDAGLSFQAFNPIISLPSNTLAGKGVGTGFATLNQITLNADFGTTNGVYANKVIVNNESSGIYTGDGWLDDGLTLANISNPNATIEATIKMETSGSLMVKISDPLHSGVKYEWECGEPNIWLNSNYSRMVFKLPEHPDIISYYRAGFTNPDTDGKRNSTTDIGAIERLGNLLKAVNINNEAVITWDETDEKFIYWYLLGNRGKGISDEVISSGLNEGDPIYGPTSSRQDKVSTVKDPLTNSGNNWGIWFLWPKALEGNDNDGKPRINGTQLTFITYDPAVVPGCIAENGCIPVYTCDKGYEEINGKCVEIPEDPTDPTPTPEDPVGDDPTPPTIVRLAAAPAVQPQAARAALVIPVTGGKGGPIVEGKPLPVPAVGSVEVLIPVTGVDFSSRNLPVFSLSGIFFGLGMVLQGISRRKK
jgi:hypothetical protein